MTTPPRKQTDPGGFSLDVSEELTPVEPRTDTDAILLLRLYHQLAPTDRKRAVQLMQNWSGCTLNRRVLIDAMARELVECRQ